VVQLTCCFVKMPTLKTRMVNCYFYELDVTEVRAVIIIIIIISIVIVKIFYILCALFCSPSYV
jgi:hypothetical protein